MEFIKDNDLPIKYHPGKVSLLADALSRKVAFDGCIVPEWRWVEQFRDMDVEVWSVGDKVMVATMGVWDQEVVNITKEGQKDNLELQHMIERIDDKPKFKLINGILYYNDRLCDRCSRHQNRADCRSTSH